MGNNIKKTEGGSGGKRGHGNMVHHEHTEDIKIKAKKSRRQQDKEIVRKERIFKWVD